MLGPPSNFEPNSIIADLPRCGHVVVPPGGIFSSEETKKLLAEARGDLPKWDPIFNDQRPYVTRAPDSGDRRVAYSTMADGKPTLGGPHASETYLPELLAAGEKLLAIIQATTEVPLFINDAAYVEARGPPQVKHRDLDSQQKPRPVRHSAYVLFTLLGKAGI